MAKAKSNSIILDNLERSAIRYALFRCKCGNPDEAHLAILSAYKVQLEEHELDHTSFNEKWDISKTDFNKLVFEKTVKQYNAINESQVQ